MRIDGLCSKRGKLSLLFILWYVNHNDFHFIYYLMTIPSHCANDNFVSCHSTEVPSEEFDRTANSLGVHVKAAESSSGMGHGELILRTFI